MRKIPGSCFVLHTQRFYRAVEQQAQHMPVAFIAAVLVHTAGKPFENVVIITMRHGPAHGAPPDGIPTPSQAVKALTLKLQDL
jgi:hypothetical protein